MREWESRPGRVTNQKAGEPQMYICNPHVVSSDSHLFKVQTLPKPVSFRICLTISGCNGSLHVVYEVHSLREIELVMVWQFKAPKRWLDT